MAMYDEQQKKFNEQLLATVNTVLSAVDNMGKRLSSLEQAKPAARTTTRSFLDNHQLNALGQYAKPFLEKDKNIKSALGVERAMHFANPDGSSIANMLYGDRVTAVQGTLAAFFYLLRDLGATISKDDYYKLCGKRTNGAA